LTTTKSNSIIFCVSSDWIGKAGTITYLNQPIVETLRHGIQNKYQAAHWYKHATNIATYNLGQSAPTGQSSGFILLEIRNNN
jgi:hypothetical protein